MNLFRTVLRVLTFGSIALSLAACQSHRRHDPDEKVHDFGDGSVKLDEHSKAVNKAMESHDSSPGSILYMSWFPDVRNEVFVDIHAGGQGTTGRIHDGEQMSLLTGVTLSPDEMDEVTRLLHSLPPSGRDVPLGNSVLVSWLDGSNWRTFVYWRTGLPAPVQRLFELTHGSIATAPSTVE